MEALLATVMHTGTTYFKDGLQRKYNLRAVHLTEQTPLIADKYDILFTTYRDPYRVGVSWANTGKLKNRHDWAVQWEQYREFLKRDPVILDLHKGRKQHDMVFGKLPMNTHRDKHDLHKALDIKDLDYYHSKVPRHMIEFALECCDGI